ncbi:LOW QUALITY PROTEIN: Retrovirus-related Pol polyprotein from transposon opus [Frankliniella fusca]|uniref:Retrovirus-related Pol polyprotein from transposon opus n=1 Tax=Frankliniella fusca TaxID=407009 RepID=A0AAE1HHY6_9NEOP|nr:LOW QUALITY PROTEIN: Retrovirus-related Pol polyprotein from transposon opus [Frankliniella fusca]
MKPEALKPKEPGKKEENSFVLDDFNFEDEVELDLLQEGMEVAVIQSKEDPTVKKIREYTETLKLKGKHCVNFKLDPGADVNVIPYDVFTCINAEGDYEFHPSTLSLDAFNQTKSGSEGCFMARTETRWGAVLDLEYEVTSMAKRPLLGREACHDFNLVVRVHHPVEVSVVTNTESRDEFVEANRDVFEGLGQFKQTIHLDVDDNKLAGMCPPRRYGISIAEKLKTKTENVKLNPTKIQYKQGEVRFLGLLWSKNKIKTDPGRIEAIQALKPPQTRLMLQKVCGVFNHLMKFIPQMVSIFKKPIHKITNNRLKKMRLKLMLFNPEVEYLPGKYMYLADLLSRNFIETPVEDDPEMVVHEVVSNLSISPGMMSQLKAETEKDAVLMAVTKYYQRGWPQSKKNIVPDSMPSWNLRNDLFVEDGLVILEYKVVVHVIPTPK